MLDVPVGTSQFAGSIEENANYSGNSIIIHPPIGTADEGTIVKVKDVEAEFAKLFVAVIPIGKAVDVDTCLFVLF